MVFQKESADPIATNLDYPFMKVIHSLLKSLNNDGNIGRQFISTYNAIHAVIEGDLISLFPLSLQMKKGGFKLKLTGYFNMEALSSYTYESYSFHNTV